MTKITKEEEEMLWVELEENGLLPINVKIVPENASYYGNDRGYDIWKGISGKLYMVIE